MKLELVLDEQELAFEPAARTLDELRQVVARSGPSDFTLQVVLTDDETLRAHNRDYRGKDRATDVLSFSYLEGHHDRREALLRGQVDGRQFLEFIHPEAELLAGQVLVSLQTLRRRGPVHAPSLDDELAFMVVHGLLHVLGYDHGTDDEANEMQALEKELMALYGARISDGGSE